MPSSSTVSTASAGSITSSTLSYSSALKSKSGTPSTAQSSPSASRSSTPSSASSRASCFSPKPYLTIHDLYMRFAPLSSLTKATMSAVSLPVSLPRVLPPMTLKDLFNRFAPKASAIPLNPPSAPSPPAPQSKTSLAPPAPQPSPQTSQAKSQDKSSAKIHSNTVDKDGRDVTKAGMKNLKDKPSPVYQRWCTFGNDYPLDCPSRFWMAREGFKHELKEGKGLDRVICTDCRVGVADMNEYSKPWRHHTKDCSFNRHK